MGGEARESWKEELEPGGRVQRSRREENSRVADEKREVGGCLIE